MADVSACSCSTCSHNPTLRENLSVCADAFCGSSLVLSWFEGGLWKEKGIKVDRIIWPATLSKISLPNTVSFVGIRLIIMQKCRR